jgi:hypothetical protein
MTKKHALIMVACCLIPIVAFALISVFRVPVSSLLSIGLVLMCPLSHLLMMKFMMKGHGEHGENHNAVQQPAGNERAVGHPAAHMKH